MWQGNRQGATNKRSMSLGNETAGQRLSPRPWRQMTEALRSQRRAHQERCTGLVHQEVRTQRGITMQ